MKHDHQSTSYMQANSVQDFYTHAYYVKTFYKHNLLVTLKHANWLHLKGLMNSFFSSKVDAYM